MSLFQELRRRSVFRVAATYAIVAWLLIQIAVSVFPTLQLPEWTVTLVTVLLILGFPIALVLAWAFELTPEGIRRSAEPKASAGTGRSALLDYALIAGLLLVAGVSFFGRPEPQTTAATQTPTATAGRPSIAVLPFADMSPQGDQEYFGDGIADELLNELARLDALDVESRTSSFAFKGSTDSITDIGDALGVATVLEGSVRKSGDSLRITAQLIDVDDGSHMWSQTYDRELTDIFEIQESIAREVSRVLGVRLGIAETNTFRGAGTDSVEAYDLFLESLSLRSPAARADLLERTVQIDPNYATAWAELGLTSISRVWGVLPDKTTAFADDALVYVNRAIELDPEDATSHSYLGTILYTRNEWSAGHAAHQRAIDLANTAPVLAQSGHLFFRAGRSSAALARWNLAARDADDAQVANWARFRAFTLIALRRFDEARVFLADARSFQQPEIELLLSVSDGTTTDVRAALETQTSIPARQARLYEPLFDVFDDRTAALELLRAVYEDPIEWPSKWYDIAILTAWYGDAEFALELLSRESSFGSPRRYALWLPIMAEARQLPEFKELVTDINLVEYWREYGWGDFCQPIGETDFVCN